MPRHNGRAGTGDKARLLLVDDHPMVCYGLTRLVDSTDDMVVCGQAEDAAQAFAAMAELKPDLAVVDIALGGEDGLGLIAQLRARWPKTLVLALSMHSEILYAERALGAGAAGYVTKQQPPADVLTALRHVLRGGVYLGEAVKDRMIEGLVGRKGSPERSLVGNLTDRELSVLRLIGMGRGTAAVAGELNLSVKTVQTHRDNIKQKLGIRTGVELGRYATLWLERESGG